LLIAVMRTTVLNINVVNTTDCMSEHVWLGILKLTHNSLSKLASWSSCK